MLLKMILRPLKRLRISFRGCIKKYNVKNITKAAGTERYSVPAFYRRIEIINNYGYTGIMASEKKVIVAMSGGVDSSVAAQLLKNKRFDLAGFFLHFWKDEKSAPSP